MYPKLILPSKFSPRKYFFVEEVEKIKFYLTWVSQEFRTQACLPTIEKHAFVFNDWQASQDKHFSQQNEVFVTTAQLDTCGLNNRL